jgi:hypothetical protein
VDQYQISWLIKRRFPESRRHPVIYLHDRIDRDGAVEHSGAFPGGTLMRIRKRLAIEEEFGGVT